MTNFREEQFPKPHRELHPFVEALERIFFWIPGIQKNTENKE